MQIRENNIIINVVYGNSTFQIATYQGEYRNLMMLIYDKLYIENFGDCKGMGRCGTCLVEIMTDHPVTTMDRNELATLSKTELQIAGGRLACQILIDASMHLATINLVEHY